MRCPDEAVLAAWVDGEVAGPDAERAAGHATSCGRCRRAVTSQRQVKRRTAGLGGPDPDAALMMNLLTLPQVEQDRALRREHRARCGAASSAGTVTRARVAVVGAGAAVWLVAAVTWAQPAGTDPPPAAPADATTPVTSVDSGPGSVMPVNRWDGVRVASWGQPAAR